jgi:hypothetical protein
MGQDCCCHRKNLNLIKKKSDIELRNNINTIRHYRNQNVSFFIVYSGVTIATLIVVASGGTATLLLSSTLTVAGAVYYIYEVCTSNAEIDEVKNELKRRENAEISIVDVSSFPIPKNRNRRNTA